MAAQQFDKFTDKDRTEILFAIAHCHPRALEFISALQEMVQISQNQTREAVAIAKQLKGIK